MLNTYSFKIYIYKYANVLYKHINIKYAFIDTYKFKYIYVQNVSNIYVQM